MADLVGALLEILGDLLIEICFEPAAEALIRLISQRRRCSPVVCAPHLAFFGATAGLLSVWLFPHRLIVTSVVCPGASILLAPVVTGFAMQLLGRQLRRFGWYPGNLATFRCGVLFAFSMALVRWWLVGPK